MPKRTTAEKEEAKRRLAEKKALREQKKAERERRKKEAASTAGASAAASATKQADGVDPSLPSPLLDLADDALSHVFCFLPAKELGALCATCRRTNHHLREARVDHLLTRLRRTKNDDNDDNDDKDGTESNRDAKTGLCEGEADAREVLTRSLVGGGDTGRIVTKKSAAGVGADEYPAYARFVEEAVCGRAVQRHGSKEVVLPHPVNGRFASASPEHSVVRTGGGDSSGGGSGAACWGVGRRGQLGQGKREDAAAPTPLLGGVGYGVRIVQVSAGGGLVRVAHTLLLTSTGRVLSFGTAQYGQLGHGYSAGRQLPDELRPRYVDALSRHCVTCVSAGELHSAAVTDDGDLYTWGDGFCGQLGLGNKRPHLTPRQVTDGGLEDECVSVVSCGNRHTLAVTEDGELFSFGLGHFGVLGRTYTPFEYDAEDGAPAPVPLTNDAVANNGGGGGNITLEMMNHLDLLANVTLDDSSDQCVPVVVDVLAGVRVVGASAGHRHSAVLDDRGYLYTFGNGSAGELGHGDAEKREFPVRVAHFDETNTRIVQFDAGVDFTMCVCSRGDVYAWGRPRGGRLGLDGNVVGDVVLPCRVDVGGEKAVDVECGYVHSLIVGLDGTIRVCGGVGVNGADDGQQQQQQQQQEGMTTAEEENANGIAGGGGGGTRVKDGKPILVPNINVWHRVAKPTTEVKKERWKKYGKYETKGRGKMMAEVEKWGI